MERLRSVKISVEVDTNKDTYIHTFVLGEHDDEESVTELKERSSEWLVDRLDF